MADGGSYTVLFTDIEKSSVMWEAARSAMEEAVARHNQLLVEAVGRHGGTEPMSVDAMLSLAEDALLGGV